MFKVGDKLRVIDVSSNGSDSASAAVVIVTGEIVEVEIVVNCQGYNEQGCKKCIKKAVKIKGRPKYFCGYRFQKLNREEKLRRILDEL